MVKDRIVRRGGDDACACERWILAGLENGPVELKIPGLERDVSVQFRPRAPSQPKKRSWLRSGSGRRCLDAGTLDFGSILNVLYPNSLFFCFGRSVSRSRPSFIIASAMSPWETMA